MNDAERRLIPSLELQKERLVFARFDNAARSGGAPGRCSRAGALG